MKRLVFSTFVVVFIVLLGLGACSFIDWKGTQEVLVTEVKLMDLQTSINTNGKVEAEKVFEIHSPLAGAAQRILVREGDTIKTGQPILTLEDSELRSELDSAKAELAAAEVDVRNVERGPPAEESNQARVDVARHRMEVENARKTVETNEWLLQRNAISRFEVEESRRALARAQQALEAAVSREENLRKRYDRTDQLRAGTRVTAAQARIKYLENRIAQAVVGSPANGILYQFGIQDGSYLNVGALIGIMADLKRLRVRAFVDEPELGRVKLGVEVLVRWDAIAGESWHGTVSHIPSQVVARGNRSVAEVLCSISSPQQNLIPNVNVDVEITTSNGTRAPALPRNALVTDGKAHFVWIIQSGRAVKRTVETGRSSASVIQVNRGVKEGDQVIVPGELSITEGMKVRARQ